MPDSEAKRKWIKENTVIFSVKIMKKSEADILDLLDRNLAKGISKNTTIKLALREFIQNHKEDIK